ncbi:hypothetical protein, partial [Pseudomonas sp. CG7]|uniref:hypothetical protein n=1 Tax=Pseudomonas sp. CG7 TaxID=191007 RepID=UPI0020347E71
MLVILIFRIGQSPCGSELARDSDRSADIESDRYTLIGVFQGSCRVTVLLCHFCDHSKLSFR